jgi:hypothetical protein
MRPLRIANCSGFYGDRLAAAQEMVDGGPIDVLTGDWLAELTMTILGRSAMKGGPGYARTFVTQMHQVLATCKERGIKVVSNAGGLDPQGCADAIAEFAPPGTTIAVVTGDNIAAEVPQLSESGEALVNLDTAEPFTAHDWQVLTANAYLGSAGVRAALAAGADVVITGRITDAALVVGPAAWWHEWDLADPEHVHAVAGAVVAGHVIECGTQATGGNYAFFTDVPGLEHPGFPIAEIAADGSSVITKHWDTNGLVSVGTVTAQLLYEIGSPTYLTPDVTAMFDTVRAELVGANRVRLSGARGQVPPPRLKVAMTRLAGFRNSMDLVITGLDVDAKADILLRAAAGVSLDQARTLPPDELARVSTWDVEQFSAQLFTASQPDPATLAASQSRLRLSVTDSDPAKVGKPVTSAIIEVGLANYPGFYAEQPPGAGNPLVVFWPTTVARSAIDEQVHIAGESVVCNREVLVDTPASTAADVEQPLAEWRSSGAATSIAVGAILGARSGDKGGIANIGVWVPDPSEDAAVEMAFGGAAAWAPAVDTWHDTEALWESDSPIPVAAEARARADRMYQWLLAEFTVDRVRRLLADVIAEDVVIHRLPALRAINIELPRALGRGVTESLSIDPQAKSLGEYLRAKIIDVPIEFVTDNQP